MSIALENKLKSLLRAEVLELHELELILQEATARSGACYILIDAVDECPDAERKILLTVLANVMADQNCKIKLCVSSRDKNVRYMKDLYRNKFMVSTSSAEGQAALNSFVEKMLKIRVDEETLKVGDEMLIQEIYDTLLAGADGM